MQLAIIWAFSKVSCFRSIASSLILGQSFSAIIGPNDLSQSNTIGVLVFVFGYCATKMQQGKLGAHAQPCSTPSAWVQCGGSFPWNHRSGKFIYVIHAATVISVSTHPGHDAFTLILNSTSTVITAVRTSWPQQWGDPRHNDGHNNKATRDVSTSTTRWRKTSWDIYIIFLALYLV